MTEHSVNAIQPSSPKAVGMGVAPGTELTAQKGGVRRVQRGGDFRGGPIARVLLSDWPGPLGTTQSAQNDGFHTPAPMPKGTAVTPPVTGNVTPGGYRLSPSAAGPYSTVTPVTPYRDRGEGRPEAGKALLLGSRPPAAGV